ncbi:hypothetical protein BT69DRAFT_1279784 [Atractiella rhizophila]|nr:hypothetical protein BT69DRAFT_1279784 [Atractiella rhizophila]
MCLTTFESEVQVFAYQSYQTAWFRRLRRDEMRFSVELSGCISANGEDDATGRGSGITVQTSIRTGVLLGPWILGFDIEVDSRLCVLEWQLVAYVVQFGIDRKGSLARTTKGYHRLGRALSLAGRRLCYKSLLGRVWLLR